eukprot:TRINITY_DN26242_c0_g1_i1.p1 TRINITY_DN26242_c0_g1~~TRINITY_DN26242_c0_g1_i1.p1  ORF type:complete len:869 (-),score=90.88 TRINITY_DN26242_c0_g1_i1:277-2883(-)
MATFTLCLHPVHEVKEGVSPMRIAEVGNAETVADRLSRLIETANAVGTRVCLKSARMMEVSVTAGRLSALNSRGERCLWLPLASSTIVHSDTHLPSIAKLEGAAGLLAYASPIASDAFSWGNMGVDSQAPDHEDASHVWIFVVMSAADSRLPLRPSAQEYTLQLAMEEFAVHGAIRGDVLGLTTLNRMLGKGSYGSVRMLNHEFQEESSDLEEFCPSPHLRLNSMADDMVRTIAAKVFTEEVSDGNACMETAYLLAAQGHPNIVRFFGLHCLMCGMDQPSLVLMMEAHDGGCLHDLVSCRGPLAPLNALKILEGLLQALVHIHGMGIVHRDVKPENILVSAGDRAILVDFGIAAHVTQESRLYVRRGSPGFIAPEFLRSGEYGVKADVFSAGVVLYYALSGLAPFARRDQDATLKANSRARPSYDRACFHACSSHVMHFLRHLLASTPQRRCSSVVAARAIARLIRESRASTSVTESHAENPLVIASAPVVQSTSESQQRVVMAPMEQDSQLVCPSASSQGLVLLEQQRGEPMFGPNGTDDYHRVDVENSNHARSEAANTKVDELSMVASSASMRVQPTIASTDNAAVSRAAHAPVIQSDVERRQVVPKQQDLQTACQAASSRDVWPSREERIEPLSVPSETNDDRGKHAEDCKQVYLEGRAAERSLEPQKVAPVEQDSTIMCLTSRVRGSLPSKQERLERLSVPGETDLDDREHTGLSEHDLFYASNAHTDELSVVAAVACTTPDQSSSVTTNTPGTSRASDPRILLREYRRKFNLKKGRAQVIPADEVPPVQHCFDAVAPCSPDERLSTQSTRSSGLFSFMRRSSCNERMGSDQDELAQSGSSLRQHASNAFKAGRSAWRVVRKPF